MGKKKKRVAQVNLCGVMVVVQTALVKHGVQQYGYHAVTQHDPPLPPGPTDERPGTFEKLEVMRLRAAARLAIHHPKDARIDWEPSSAKQEVIKIMAQARPRSESWNNF